MTRANYTAKQQAAFLRAYLFCLGSSLKQSSFDQALEMLITLEASQMGSATIDAENRKLKCPMHAHG